MSTDAHANGHGPEADGWLARHGLVAYGLFVLLLVAFMIVHRTLTGP